jgi:tetratricopeptide (TPR) repeat protein
MRKTVSALFFLLSSSAQACPDLSAFYLADQSPASQSALVAALTPLMTQCLQSAEYFALVGAAQMESGDLATALESLERALLLDPGNGAAQIDYAQALYLRGQLFSALDLNRQILARTDLPPDIEALVRQRDQLWQARTRQTGFQLDALVGYDDNLNGAPDPSQIALTLSGEPIILTLNSEFQAVAGRYLNLRGGASHQRLAAGHRHNARVEIRGRMSQDSGSDLLQLQSRYEFLRPRRSSSWMGSVAAGQLFFGGSALYAASEAFVRYSQSGTKTCGRRYDLTLQHQHFHGQRTLNSLEAKLAAGVECQMAVAGLPSVLGLELGLLSNTALNSGRPGGHRRGWQVNADWQWPVSQGVLRSQMNYTRLRDQAGYSPLLASGADRWLERSYLLLQYQRPIQPGLMFLTSFYHQYQRSNIALFDTRDSSLEIGLSFAF